MRNRLTVILLLWALAAGTGRSQETPTVAKVRLEVVLIVRNGDYQLAQVLRSEDSRTFVLRRSELPWGEASSLYLDTFIPDSRGAKLGSTPRGQATQGDARLEAARILSGELNLNRLFPGLESMLTVHPVIIYWAYQFRATEPAADAQWQAGSFVIPKGGLQEGATLR